LLCNFELHALGHANACADEEMVTALGWTTTNELFTCSDDKTIWRWSANGEPLGKVMQLETYVTSFHWFPARQAGQAAPKASSEVFVIGCVDGTFRLVSKQGREEKSVPAHIGAVVALRWNYEGTALVTCGEDGVVKVWSRSGMLRSTLATLDRWIFFFATCERCASSPVCLGRARVCHSGHDAQVCV
jgi:intraflagellar transport protein 80